MGMKRNDHNASPHSIVAHAPFSLFPYDFSHTAFLKAISLSPLFNDLISNVSNDYEWILKILLNASIASFNKFQIVFRPFSNYIDVRG